MTTHIDQQQRPLDNAIRQAKRLRNLLGIPLTAAQNILAEACYGCDGWNDLTSRLEMKRPLTGALVLALPPGNPQGTNYLAKNLQTIARAIRQYLVAGRNLVELCEIVRSTFEIKGKAIDLFDLAHLTCLPI